MKKRFTKIMLLLFALVVGIGNAWAENITFNATSGSGTDVSWFTGHNQATNTPTYNSNASELRLYPKCYITISSSTKKIASVSFTYSANVGGKNNGKATPTGVSVDTGTIDDFYTSSGSNAQGATGQTATWTADNEETSSFTITVNGAKGNYGFVSASVTFVEGGGTPLTPVSISLSGDYPTTFFVGDAFSHQGMVVTATFDDNSQSNVTSSAEFTGYDMSQAGNQTVTVSYTSNEVEVTKTYGITVNAIPDKTIAQFISAGGGKCYLTGTVSNIVNTTFGNFNLTDDSGTIYVYGCLTSNGQSGQFLKLDIEADDVIKVLANTYQYYNNTTHEAVNVIFVEEIVPNAQTLTVSATNGNVEITGKTLVNNSCEVTEGASVTATATPADHYTFTSWSATGVTLANNAANPLTFTMPTNGVSLTANFTEDAKYIATFNVLNNSSNATVYEGAAITFPSVTAPNGYTFMGWTTSPIAGIQDDAPATLVSSDNMGNANVDYYAVFAIQTGGSADTYSLVEEDDDLNDGDIVVLYSSGSYKTSGVTYTFSKANGVISDGLFSDEDVEVDNDQFTSTDVVPMTLVQTNSKWKLQIGSQFVTAVIKGVDLDDNGSENSISITDGEATITASISSTDYNLQYNPNSGNGRFAYYSSTQKSVKLFKQNTPTYSNYCTSVNPLYGDLSEASTSSGNAYYISAAANVPADKTATINGALGNGTASNLVIHNGGQLVLADNNSLKATVEKTITAPTSWSNNNNTGWYAISSPVGNIAPSSVTYMTLDPSNNIPQYDLYKYVENMGWYNAQTQNQSISTLENGNGYLYARSADAILSFVGTVSTTGFSLTNLSKSEVKHSGLHLIGNPYTHDIYLGTAITGTNLTTTGYYALNSDGLWISKAYTEPIKPMQAVFVFVTNATNTINFSNKPSATRAHHDYIRFTVANSQYEDVAYAMFDKGYGLNKIEHRNSEAPMLYIPQDDDNYAIAMMEDVTKMFNLSFKAATTGRYTLSFDTQGEYNYLHVIDRLTGEDVDMLLEGEYSFIGSPNDNENRFVVKLAYKPDYSEGNNEIFAFQSGSDILISGEGELQVFDVMGRFVMSERINGATSISADELSKGVYVLRIVGTEIKTQKIVVR